MKKLLLAMSVLMLTIFTSCNNSESSTTSEEQQNQTFSGNEASKDDSEEEIENFRLEAIKMVQEDRSRALSGSLEPRPLILCHTNYESSYGHSCVYSGGYLFEVTWQPMPLNGGNAVDPMNSLWTANLVTRCDC